MDQFNLVFSGDILPGHEPDEVKAKLVKMLGVAPDKADRLFSGKPIVIKKDLDADKAQAYRRKLATMGIGIRVESQSAPTQTTAPSTSPALAPMTETGSTRAGSDTPPDQPDPTTVLAEQMNCPECGHAQPKRTLCINCGIDMPRFLAAQAQQKEEASVPGGLAAAASIRTYEHAPIYTEADERPPFFGLSFEGRLSRRSYFTGTCLLGLVMFATTFAAFAAGMPKLLYPVGIVFLFLFIRLGVLRTHDFNWAGWWVLLTAIPGIGLVYSLLMSFFPGSPEANNFGEKPEPTSWARTVGAFGLLVLIPVVVALIAPANLARGLSQFAGQTPANADDMGVVASMDLTGYDPALNDLVMYSLTTCGYCAQKRAQFETLGVRYVEVFIDIDSGANQALQTKLEAIGYRGRGVGTPVIEINGTLLPNNPSLDEIGKYFYRRRT